jgi:hypothetical protein
MDNKWQIGCDDFKVGLAALTAAPDGDGMTGKRAGVDADVTSGEHVGLPCLRLTYSTLVSQTLFFIPPNASFLFSQSCTTNCGLLSSLCLPPHLWSSLSSECSRAIALDILCREQARENPKFERRAPEENQVTSSEGPPKQPSFKGVSHHVSAV